ncbi:hypothetical protein BOSE62_71337 [Bosea sp. 62]|nr:hypothetical protein BOSE7B_60375 [Bosea sp. 7B]VVT60936.1 hypothetical protein BOS5A_230213 [Bosea sp. EC-HK365B]VXB35734.1 hypothetical protein BOSE127_110374 [Bosea sp. 127]VXC76485.1 hypothetical protein BOSE29B_80276 [Bosea sp. 29B]VXC90241.1 hypothetical protein BOSE62_71337 [Bosea sp. 62]
MPAFATQIEAKRQEKFDCLVVAKIVHEQSARMPLQLAVKFRRLDPGVVRRPKIVEVIEVDIEMTLGEAFGCLFETIATVEEGCIFDGIEPRQIPYLGWGGRLVLRERLSPS